MSGIWSVVAFNNIYDLKVFVFHFAEFIFNVITQMMCVSAVQLFHSCHLLYYNSAFVQHSCLRIQHELSCCYFVILPLWVSDLELLKS
jgi:hypothetical protein